MNAVLLDAVRLDEMSSNIQEDTAALRHWAPFSEPARFSLATFVSSLYLPLCFLPVVMIVANCATFSSAVSPFFTCSLRWRLRSLPKNLHPVTLQAFFLWCDLMAGCFPFDGESCFFPCNSWSSDFAWLDSGGALLGLSLLFFPSELVSFCVGLRFLVSVIFLVVSSSPLYSSDELFFGLTS